MDTGPQKILVHGDIEPELLQPTPRKVQFRFFGILDHWIVLTLTLPSVSALYLAFQRGSFFQMLCFPLVLVAGIWCCTFLTKWHMDKRLVKSGVVGRATVTRKYREGKNRLIEYEFVPPLADNNVEAGVGSNRTSVSLALLPFLEWSQFEEGKQITVLYDPANPKMHTPYFASYFRAM
jgi:hypothetical protein